MTKSKVFLTAAPIALAGTLLPTLAVQAQGTGAPKAPRQQHGTGQHGMKMPAGMGKTSPAVNPGATSTASVDVSKPSAAERSLVGISLGRRFEEVLRRYGQPNEIQTVALESTPDQLPGVGGGAAAGIDGGASGMSGFGGGPAGYPGGGPSMGSSGMGGYPGRPAGMMGSSGFGSAPMGSSSFGGPPMGSSSFGGVPSLPPAGGPQLGEVSGPGGSVGSPAGIGAAGGTGQPEYSTALLYIYKRPGNVRLEFLANEDGRIAQISVAAPTNKTKNVSFPGAKTSRGVTLGSSFVQVSQAYGYPERNRMLPGFRFYEAYYTKKNHAAFTFDQQTMKVARITIALAD